MGRRILIVLLLSLLLIVSVVWIRTQPVLISNEGMNPEVLNALPATNKRVLQICVNSGERIAPSYAQSVCTEFAISVIDSISPLTKKLKNEIRIITEEDLATLIEEDSPITKGIASALSNGGLGEEIDPYHTKPGDFVQLWTVLGTRAFGHCGIVVEAVPGETLTLYSSHPITGGFGKQVYLWPDKAYFVRLR